MTRRVPHTNIYHNFLIFSVFFFIHRRFIETALALLLMLSPSISAFALAKPPPKTDISLFPLVTKGLEQPVFVTHSGDQGQRLFIVEQAGRIRVLENERLLPIPFLDITNRVNFGGERGLLGLAFHPKFSKNGRFFVNYSRATDGATVISEFHVSGTTHRAQPAETILLVISQPYGNHNGGMIAFGPDGFLYMATGDGGASGDLGNRGQNQTELLGKILRIDIDHGAPYSIPKDNPFATQQQGREIFALGFRNPWRFSFDNTTGELWAADVGQNRWEEIDRVEKGKNYGWRIMEGMHCFKPSTDCPQSGLTLPIAEYANESGRCSITGGYVYRGKQVPHLQGTYIFGDYCSGEVMGLVNNRVTVFLSTGLRIASFGEDATGELYVVDHGGGVYRITGPPAAK
jgi:glucose/arabinose dehydrogenase